MKAAYFRKVILALIIPAIILSAWYFTTTYGSVPRGILPTIPMVGDAFVDLIKSGKLKEDLLISLSRVIKGYLISAFFGIILGSLVGMFRPVKELFIPIITVIRQIPMIAWIPLIILWCGIGEASKIAIIVLVAFFQILVNTQSGIESTPKGYIEVAKLYKLSRWKTFVKVYLPNAIPQILVGLRLGLGGSWMAVVAAELIAATSGIGYRMSTARSNMQSDVVIACMIVVGLAGVLMDKGVYQICNAFTSWNKSEKKKS